MKKTIWGILILLIALSIAGVIYFKIRKDDKSTENLQQIIVQKSTVTKSVQASGTVEPRNKVQILPPVAGRIDNILIEEGDLVKSGQVISWMSSTNRASLLDFARTKGKAEQKKWEDSYLPTPIIAPVSGRIISKQVVPGQTITLQTVLFEMSDILIIRAQVDETDIGKITIDMAAEVSCDAFPKNILPASVTKIAHQSELVNNVNVYQVELTLDEKADFLKAGMTANVEFIIEKKDNVLTIPLAAVGVDINRSLMVIDSQGKEKKLSLGLSDGANVEILNGANEGESLFIKPFKFKDSEKTQGNSFLPIGRDRKRGNSGSGRAPGPDHGP